MILKTKGFTSGLPACKDDRKQAQAHCFQSLKDTLVLHSYSYHIQKLADYWSY